VRGITDINPIEESLMKFLVIPDLNILKHGNKPTFIACNKEVIDLTFGTIK
jgi:hypothetical protein